MASSAAEAGAEAKVDKVKYAFQEIFQYLAFGKYPAGASDSRSLKHWHILILLVLATGTPRPGVAGAQFTLTPAR